MNHDDVVRGRFPHEFVWRRTVLAACLATLGLIAFMPMAQGETPPPVPAELLASAYPHSAAKDVPTLPKPGTRSAAAQVANPRSNQQIILTITDVFENDKKVAVAAGRVRVVGGRITAAPKVAVLVNAGQDGTYATTVTHLAGTDWVWTANLPSLVSGDWVTATLIVGRAGGDSSSSSPTQGASSGQSSPSQSSSGQSSSGQSSSGQSSAVEGTSASNSSSTTGGGSLSNTGVTGLPVLVPLGLSLVIVGAALLWVVRRRGTGKRAP